MMSNCFQRARLEDVVVSPDYRGKQLGKWYHIPTIYLYNNILNVYQSILTFSIVEILTNLGRALGAYKMTLDCKDTLTPFYESLGYSKESGNSNTLSIRYPSKPTTKL